MKDGGTALSQRSIGKYQLVHKLGDDGRVERYLAEHKQIGRTVELHCLVEGETRDSGAAQEMLREARVFGSATHRNVQGVVDSGRDDEGKPYVVFEAMRGRSLATLIGENPRGIDSRSAAQLVVQLLEALRALHDAGVVLRTFTPADVTLEKVTGDEHLVKIRRVQGAALLIDGAAEPIEDVKFTVYLAPELRRGESGSDPRVDLFTVGIILRELLTGTPRGDDESLSDTARRALARACAEDPDERFAGAEGFLQAAVLLLPDSDRPPREQVPTPQDPLSADLQYLHLRRITRHGPGSKLRGDSRLNLLPVLLTIEAVYRRFGEGVWQALAERVEHANALLPGAGNTPVHLENGVPVPVFAEILLAVDQIAGDGDMALVAQLGEAVGQRGLLRLFPELPEPITTDAIISGFPYIWSRVSLDGNARARKISPNSARLWVSDQPTPSLELAGWTAGLLRDAFRQAGSDEVEVFLIAAQALGDGRDLFGVDWR